MNVINVVPMPPARRTEPSSPHVPVMAEEIVAVVAPRRDGIYVDATVGAGGHTAALLAAGAGRVVALDRDPRALAAAQKRLARQRVDFRCARFSSLRDELAVLDIAGVDGVIADLGVSSMQLDEPERGMSFRAEGPIDMRMGSEGETALELIERLEDEDLADLIARLGEERRARRVARCIKQELARGSLKTTLDLRRAVVRAVGPARVGGVDPATRTFQALRIAVNDELGELTRLIDAAADVLVPGGVLAIIAFHSLEDRVVKRMLRDRARWEVLSKGPVLPDELEIDDNPRARSAKLRAARRKEVAS
jgi:16S rRNA (cytosine1402-N4)-methyltransferase